MFALMAYYWWLVLCLSKRVRVCVCVSATCCFPWAWLFNVLLLLFDVVFCSVDYFLFLLKMTMTVGIISKTLCKSLQLVGDVNSSYDNLRLRLVSSGPLLLKALAAAEHSCCQLRSWWTFSSASLSRGARESCLPAPSGAAAAAAAMAFKMRARKPTTTPINNNKISQSRNVNK